MKHQAKKILLFQKDVFIFMSENKAMKTAFTYPLSLSAPNKLFACLVVYMFKLLYNSDIQAITPPRKSKDFGGLAGLKAGLFVAAMNASTHSYFANSLCLIAQQNIFFGWGRISSIEVTPPVCHADAVP
jgi:hypothetical protein